jgi:hypothetical protein
MRKFGIAELECCSVFVRLTLPLSFARLKAALEPFPKRKESGLPEICSCSIYI